MRGIQKRAGALTKGLLVCCLLAGALTGCAAKGVKAVKKEDIVLTFRHGWTSAHDRQLETILQDTVLAFERTHPRVKVILEGIDPALHREHRLRNEMVAGNPPDLFSVFGGVELRPYAKAGRLLDLSDFLAGNGLAGSFYDLGSWSLGEAVYGLPLEGVVEPVYYSKTLFNKLGLEPPQTGEQLLAVIQRLRAGGYIPFALGNKERWPGALYGQYFFQRYAGDPGEGFMNNSSTLFNSLTYEAAAESFSRFLALDPFPEDVNQLTKEEAAELFISGKAGMFLNGSWGTAVLQKGMGGAVGVFNFPVLSDAGNNANGIAGGYLSGISLSADLSGERKAAALELLQALFTLPVQERLVYEALRFPSMRMEVDYNRTGPVHKQISDLLVTRPTFVPYDNAMPADVQSLFFDTLSDWIGEGLTPEAAIRRFTGKTEVPPAHE